MATKTDYALTNLKMQLIRQGGLFILYSHVLDISTTGKSEKEATGKFESILKVFLKQVVKNETDKKGAFSQALLDLGWKQKGKRWTPPMIKSGV